MAALKVTLICFGFFAINLRNVRAISDSEKSGILNGVLPLVLECTADYDIGSDVGKLLESLDSLDGLNPCLIACVIKKLNLLNDKGMFDTKAAKKLNKKYLTEEEDIKNGLEIIEKCSKVNEEEVSDGEKGCERAKLFAKCVLPHRHLFLPSL